LAEVKGLHGAQWAPGNKRIHITGAPRSGTTLLLALMLSCFEIDGGITSERRLWRTPTKGRRVVCTKFPNETDFATAMLPLDPDLHVIFLLRDPRDVIVSQSHLAPGRYLTNLRVWRDNLEMAKPYFGHPRFHVVDYAELANDPDRVQTLLADDMPFLRPVRSFSRFLDCADERGGEWLVRMHMKLRPVAADRVGSWRNHLKRVKGQMLIHGDVSDELIALGFEPDKAWLSALDGVRPDVRASAALERLWFGKLVTQAWRNSIGTIVYLARRYLDLELYRRAEARILPFQSAANENAARRETNPLRTTRSA
jgi:hypothetical protein